MLSKIRIERVTKISGLVVIIIFLLVFSLISDSSKAKASNEMKLTKILSNNVSNYMRSGIQLADKTVIIELQDTMEYLIFSPQGDNLGKTERKTTMGSVTPIGKGRFIGQNTFENKYSEFNIKDNKGNKVKTVNLSQVTSKARIEALQGGNVLIITTSNVTIVNSNGDVVNSITKSSNTSVAVNNESFLLVKHKSNAHEEENSAENYVLYNNVGDKLKEGSLLGEEIKQVDGVKNGGFVGAGNWSQVRREYSTFRYFDTNMNKKTVKDRDYFLVGFYESNKDGDYNIQFKDGSILYNGKWFQAGMYDVNFNKVSELGYKIEGFKFKKELSNNKFFMGKDKEVLIYRTDGSLLLNQEIDEYIGDIYELNGGKILNISPGNYSIYQLNEPGGGGGNDGGNNGGGNTNQITSVIFLPKGSSAPKGFENVGGDVYSKSDAGYEVVVYVVRYTPPSTIGNLNIQ